jgi:hypothetical protein
MADTVTISKETAEIINHWFLPLNPNKLRRGYKHQDDEVLVKVRTACHEFKTALQKEG